MLKVVKVGGYIVFTDMLNERDTESEHEKDLTKIEDEFHWKFTTS